MSKHFKPTEITLAEFWLLIDGDEREVHASLKEAEKSLLSGIGGTVWHCRPGEARMVDLTADLAQQWLEASEDVYDDAPDCFEAYIGAEVRSRRDDYEDRGSRGVSQHSTHYRGVGI